MKPIEEEVQAKVNSAMAEGLNSCNNLLGSGLIGSASQLAGDYYPSLLDRVRESGYHAHEQASRLAKLAELEALLEKNPEIARILDLIEQVHV